MSTYQKFLNGILPGNYALTKSMEITKVNTSGTLWYTKKFLVLYYHVFLSKDMIEDKYINTVIEKFDVYIDSIDSAAKESAMEFFYPNNPYINLKSENFKKFSDFYNGNNNTELHQAKKAYFTMLMDSGGQTGIKEKIKEAYQNPEFIYSISNINNKILEATIDICTNQIVETGRISDNSVKAIISKESMDKLCKQANMLTKEKTREIIKESDNHPFNYRSVENDVVAFIRNERQILYYYGYFHSKSLGASDFEFSSLTPVGELALSANFHEFLVLWEHQKIKMISQPATAEIKNIPENIEGASNFSISFSPYIDILGHIYRKRRLSYQEYQYIVSRKNHNISYSEYINAEQDILAKITEIKDRIDKFSRSRDIATEDSRKELKKYLLGIQSNLNKDNSTNPLGIISTGGRGGVENDNQDKLTFIYTTYSKLNKYKIEKNEGLFIECENDLRKRYVSASQGNEICCDAHVKIDWDLYNIKIDKFILFSIVMMTAFIKNNQLSFENISEESIFEITKLITEKFSTFLNELGIINQVDSEVKKTLSILSNNDYSEFLVEKYNQTIEEIDDYKRESAQDLFDKIQNSSHTASQNYGNRVRSSSLKNLLKAYYVKRFSEENLLKCECCQNTTFITNKGEPYIEFHHLIPFNIAEGPDHYLNLFALCPNCHRKIHFLNTKEKEQEYEKLKENNFLELNFMDRLKKLNEDTILRSYHLEYLLAENAINESEYQTIVEY